MRNRLVQDLWNPRAIGALALLTVALPATAQGLETYRGSCDASAAVALDADRFVVANDENNALQVYRRGVREPEAQVDLSAFLGLKAGDEADIEGAAAIGDRIYWISSHGRNSKGKQQPARMRLFATENRPGSSPAVVPVGRPYSDLLRELTQSSALKEYRLAHAATLAAEAEGGLNIEGLAATPDGRLLIGFRNPLRSGRALIVPIDNPARVIDGERARLGAPIELNLRDRGIRSFERVGSSYLVVAGPTGDVGSFALYRWSGNTGEPPVELSVDLGDLRPEALFAVPGSDRVQLLSDDGGIRIGGRECKALPLNEQQFRSLTIVPAQNP